LQFMENYNIERVLARHFSGDSTHEDEQALAIWLSENKENQNCYNELKLLWKNAKPESPKEMPEVINAWREMSARVEKTRRASITDIHQSSYRFRNKSSSRVFSAAVIAILLVGTALVYKTKLFGPDIGWKQIHTQNAQRTRVNLSDGSVVQINSGTKFRYPASFSDSVRSVFVDGEIFLNVSHDGRPFIVNTPNAAIRVLGTEFNIWSRWQSTRVIVRDGRVALNSLNDREHGVVINTNEMSVCRQHSNPDSPKKVDARHLVGWIQDRVVFEKTPLYEVVDELQRCYNVKIVLEDMTFGHRTLTGSFHEKSVTSVLQSICLTLKLKLRREAGIYVIFG